MAELEVEGSDLVVRLRRPEKFWCFHGNIRVPLSAVRSASSESNPWKRMRGWRMAGAGIPYRVALGTWRHGQGFDFYVVRHHQAAVEIETNSGRFSRFLISYPAGTDTQVEADRIADAAGIARSPGGPPDPGGNNPSIGQAESAG